MKKAFLLSAFVSLAAAGSVQASYISGAMVNGENLFSDQSREAFVDTDNSNTVSIGDVFLGFLRIDSADTAGINTSGHIYGVFSQQIASITPGVGTLPGTINQTIGFTHTAKAGLTLSDIAGVPAPGFFAVYDSVPAFPTDLINASPGDLTGNGTTNLFDYLNSITANGTLEFTAGIGDFDDFLQAKSADYVAGSSNDYFTDLTKLPTLTASSALAHFDGGLTVLQNNMPNVTFHEAVDAGIPPPFSDLYDIVVRDGSVSKQSSAARANEWANTDPETTGIYTNTGGFTDHADFLMNVTVTPEPMSVMVLAIGVLGVFGAARRRRLSA